MSGMRAIAAASMWRLRTGVRRPFSGTGHSRSWTQRGAPGRGISKGKVTDVTGETSIASQARDVGVEFVAHIEVIDRNRWICAGGTKRLPARDVSADVLLECPAVPL